MKSVESLKLQPLSNLLVAGYRFLFVVDGSSRRGSELRGVSGRPRRPLELGIEVRKPKSLSWVEGMNWTCYSNEYADFGFSWGSFWFLYLKSLFCEVWAVLICLILILVGNLRIEVYGFTAQFVFPMLEEVLISFVNFCRSRNLGVWDVLWYLYMLADECMIVVILRWSCVRMVGSC